MYGMNLLVPNGLPWFEHTFVWAKRRSSRTGIGYHVLALPRDMSLSRRLGTFIEGQFLILPQRRINRAFGVTLPLRRKRVEWALTDIQFVVWNIWAANSISAFALSPQGRSTPFAYRIPDCNCITWTDQAINYARIISLLPL